MLVHKKTSQAIVRQISPEQNRNPSSTYRIEDTFCQICENNIRSSQCNSYIFLLQCQSVPILLF